MNGETIDVFNQTILGRKRLTNENDTSNAIRGKNASIKRIDHLERWLKIRRCVKEGTLERKDKLLVITAIFGAQH